MVWVRDGTGDDGRPIIKDISLATIWREDGDFPAGERVATELLSCHDPKCLCPSCRVFGMADTTGQAESAEQRSYASHVRFASATSLVPPEPVEHAMNPLMSPRPGFGPFYLELTSTAAAVLPKRTSRDDKTKNPPPTGHWAKGPDDAAHPRRLRGRKYYWHADPDPQPPANTELGRWYTQAHDADEAKDVSRAWTDEVPDAKAAPRWLIHDDFSSELAFDNLSLDDLGGLIAALEPRWLFAARGGADGRVFATHLGGGKPLGLGTVVPTIKNMQCWGADRYLETEAKADSDWQSVARDAVATFVDGHGAMRPQWEALARVLDIRAVDPNLVWYPPGAERDQFGTKEFTETFKFFAATSGDGRHRNKEGKPQELVPLPDPRCPDQALHILLGDSQTRRDQS
jgi:CRISPR-associated protein (TIGR03986 family)